MAKFSFLQRIREQLRRSRRSKPEPEPYRPLVNPRPRIDGNILVQRWPPGLVQKLYNYLSPADRVCLSLACRATRAAIRRRRETLQGPQLFKFLLRLERDGACADDILCSVCLKFHTPRKSPDWDITTARRRCVNFGDREMVKRFTSVNLPPQIHFDLIASQTRKQRHRQKAQGLINSYTPQTLFTTANYWDNSGTVRIWSYITCRVMSGRFIIKTENVLLPASDPRDALQGAADMSTMLHKLPGLGCCCAHVHWTTARPYLFSPEVEMFPTRGYADTHLHQCLWTHDKCTGFKYNNIRIKRCGDIVSADLGNVMGCPHCATDFTVNKKRSDLGVNMLVLTSWKDLGRGIDIADPCWRSHLEPQLGMLMKRPEDCHQGQIFRSFEMRGPKYQPSVRMWRQCDEKMQRRWAMANASDPSMPERRRPRPHLGRSDASLSPISRARVAAYTGASQINSSSSYSTMPELPSLPSPVALDPTGSYFGVHNFQVDDGDWEEA